MSFNPVLPEEISGLPINLHWVSGSKRDSVSEIGVCFYEGGVEVNRCFEDVASGTPKEAVAILNTLLLDYVRSYYHLSEPTAPTPPLEEPVTQVTGETADAETENSPDGNGPEAGNKPRRPARVPRPGRQSK